jgi:uncharacterized membrane protein YeaQ/YmgE (transglycosylase-associated protein family)
MFSDGGIYLLVGTMIASSLMDKQGRKSLLITSFSGMVMPLCSTNHVFTFSLNQQMEGSYSFFSSLKGASMLLLALSFTWKALAPYSGTLAVVGTVL